MLESKVMDRIPYHFEKSLFEMICLMIIIVMMHGLIQGVILFGLNILPVIELVIALVAGLFLYLSRYRGKFELLRIPLVIFANAFLIFFWFWLSGYNGPTGIGAVGIGIISIVILPKKWRLTFLIYLAVLLLSLVVIQMTTNWVQTKPTDYETLPYDYLVILFSVLLIVNYLKNAYEKERRIVFKQNKELEGLNRELKNAISATQETLEKLKTAQKRLVESEKLASIGRLTAGIAHELNNPLNYIGGSVPPIMKDLDELKDFIDLPNNQPAQLLFEEIALLLNNIQNGSHKASIIIGNLIGISPKSMSFEPSIINLTKLVDECIAVFLNSHSSILFTNEIEDSVIINGNINEISQVIMNVLKNAVEAVEVNEKGKIKTRLYSIKSTCIIEITDNGSGIKNELEANLFEPFFSTKDEGKGSGLGLYMAYTIMEKHDGKIQFIKLKSGSRFKISFPLA